jgi:hypothetical protein
LERVHNAVAMWPTFAEHAGVSRKSADVISAKINR